VPSANQPRRQVAAVRARGQAIKMLSKLRSTIADSKGFCHAADGFCCLGRRRSSSTTVLCMGRKGFRRCFPGSSTWTLPSSALCLHRRTAQRRPSFAFICQADDVTTVKSEGQLACRYSKCGKVVRASDLRAHVGVHMLTDPDLSICGRGFCGGLCYCTAALSRNR
jgi:hypothetical protein